MKNIFQKLALFPHKNSDVNTNHETKGELTFIRSKKEIAKQIHRSKEDGSVLGIYSQIFGDGMFLCGIEDCYMLHGQEVVVLKPYDMNGLLLLRNEIDLSEIRGVCPIPGKYINPLMKQPV
jgi:hypothetical protein